MGDLITLADIAGRLTHLHVECTKCGRSGRYNVARLLATHGPETTLHAITDPLSADCPNRRVAGYYDRCNVRCPDLPKVIL